MVGAGGLPGGRSEPSALVCVTESCGVQVRPQEMLQGWPRNLKDEEGQVSATSNSVLQVGRTLRLNCPFQEARPKGRAQSSPLWPCRRSGFH